MWYAKSQSALSIRNETGSETAVEQLSQQVMIASSTIPLELCNEYSTLYDTVKIFRKFKKFSARTLSMTRMRTL